jgi:anti-sigma B factor antagonist
MFKVKIDKGGSVFLSGRLDASQVDRARGPLDGITQSSLVDCSELEYISSAGIGLLLVTYKRLEDAGCSFRLVNASPRIRTVLAYAGLDTLLLAD